MLPSQDSGLLFGILKQVASNLMTSRFPAFIRVSAMRVLNGSGTGLPPETDQELSIRISRTGPEGSTPVRRASSP